MQPHHGAGSADGRKPARTLQTNRSLGMGPVGAVGIEISRDEQSLYCATFGAGSIGEAGRIFRSSVRDEPELLYTADPGV